MILTLYFFSFKDCFCFHFSTRTQRLCGRFTNLVLNIGNCNLVFVCLLLNRHLPLFSAGFGIWNLGFNVLYLLPSSIQFRIAPPAFFYLHFALTESALLLYLRKLSIACYLSSSFILLSHISYMPSEPFYGFSAPIKIGTKRCEGCSAS